MANPTKPEGDDTVQLTQARADWRTMRLWQIQPVRDLLVLAVIYGILHLGYVLRPVTVPILLALALAYLFEPLVSRITGKGQMRRPFAAAVIIFGVALAVVVPVTVGGGFAMMQGAKVAQSLGTNIAKLNDSLAKPDDEELKSKLPAGAWRSVRDFMLKVRTGLALPPIAPTKTDAATPPPAAEAASHHTGSEPAEERSLTAAESWAGYAIEWLRGDSTGLSKFLTQNVLGGGRDAAQILFNLLVSIFYFGFTLFLTLFFFFFFCAGWGRVKGQLVQMIPERNRDRTLELLGKMDGVIAGFIRGRLVISLILSVEFSIGFWAIGVPAPLILGAIVGVLSIVPYLAMLGIPVAIILLWLNPSSIALQNEWWWVLFAPAVLYWLIQNTDDYIWSPMIQGKATDMDMPSILFSVLAGGILAGIYGVMIAIPAGACVKILIKEVLWPRFQSWAKGTSKDFLPISRA